MTVPVRVFLVEDMPSLQGVVVDLLRSIGNFEIVGVVATEAEALLWLDEHRGGWDLALVDLVLEQGTGMGVIARAHKQRGPDGKLVVFSDYVSPGIEKHCLRLGADKAFVKSDSAGLISFCSTMLRTG